jgi:cysteinyl-tRNA synthetase
MKWLNTFREKKISRIPIVFLNTLSGEKEVFKSLNDQVVKMYNCGPTVYNYQHIGNLRSYVFADTLRRVLTYNGYAVQQVINITDVGHLTSDADEGEDKMTLSLKREGKKLTLKNMKALGHKYAKAFIADLEKLSVATERIIFTYASDHIAGQIALAQSLEEKGYAYITKDGVYFETKRFAEYGKLGNLSANGQSRIEANPEKHNPADFALWKFNPELGWESPWGKGFPGWHLECTAMIFAELGKQIDIHTGGIDHIPIHHNNEIAQAESATGKQYVRYWLHNAFITIEGQKIAKSVGNTIYLRNIVDRGFNPLSYRYWLLTAHYASPVNFTWKALEGAQTALARLHRYFIEELGSKNGMINEEYQTRFHRAVNDNLDTPQAIALLWELIRDEGISEKDKRATLIDFDKVLGLGLIEGSRKLKAMLRESEKRIAEGNIPSKIQQLLDERERARTQENWEAADRLRKQIEQAGFIIEDTEKGPKLRKV